MKTYKEKAEAYVRKQLPELMELSLGCEVKFTYCFDFEDDNETRKQITAIVVGGGFYDNSVEVVTTDIINDDWKNIQLQLMKNDVTLEIIGHPIQLQHWLRVLKDHSDVEVMLHYHKVHYLAVQQPMGKTAEFNLTTGQPATEADYQAFCDIVGI